MVSVKDLRCCLEKAAKRDNFKEVVKQASGGPLKGILGYTEDQVVSLDFNSDAHSTTFDSGAGNALDDNDIIIFPGMTTNGSSNRMVDLHGLQGARRPGAPTPARTQEQERSL